MVIERPTIRPGPDGATASIRSTAAPGVGLMQRLCVGMTDSPGVYVSALIAWKLSVRID